MLTIIVPCYNELTRGLNCDRSLSHRLELLLDSVSKLNSVEVIIVNDCSSDNTATCVMDFIDEHDLDNWKCLLLSSNNGKGNAILQGIRKARGSYICYLDADLAVSPTYIIDVYRMIDYYERQGRYVCFYGTRFDKDSRIINKRSLVRNFISKSSRLLLNILFDLKISDIQCGFKVFPTCKISPYLDFIYPSRWLLDIELLYILKNNGVELHKLCVNWNNLEQESTVKTCNAVYNSLIDLFKIFRLKKTLKSKFN